MTHVHLLQPRSDTAPHPSRVLLYPFRWFGRWVLRRRFRIGVHGAAHVPASGPVIFAANHVGVIDGPVLAIFAPRPVHTLTKKEMFGGRSGRFFRACGQIPLDRFGPDPAAMKQSLRVLRDGRAVGIFPEGARGAGEFSRFHRGAAYLALVSGAPIIPVVLIGTREPGGHTDSLPPRGSRVDIVCGPPFQVQRAEWPRTRQHVEMVSMELREWMLTHLSEALVTTGRTLPGPLPVRQREPDPAGGVSGQAAS